MASPSPSRPSITSIAALAAASLLGGGAALGGVWALGGLDSESTTTVVERDVAPTLPAASSSGLTVQQIYRRASSAVVQVTSTLQARDGLGGFPTPSRQALGSGFVLDKAGHIVTNYHVVQDADKIEVSFTNKDTLDAKVVGVDPSTDLALLEVKESPEALTPLGLADSDRVQVGDPVVAIGNPFGLERTVTAGIVSALQRAVTAPNGFTIDHVIQTDAPINQGNSGGPLISARGEVIGVNSQIQTGGSGDGNVGIGFAVPSNTVKSVVAQILADGKVAHAFLGVGARPVDEELSRMARLPVDAGLLVEEVTPGSAADKAGLVAGTRQIVVAGESYRLGGDVIVTAGGERVTSVGALRDVLAAHRPGDRLRLEIFRGESKRTVVVTLGRQPSTLNR